MQVHAFLNPRQYAPAHARKRGASRFARTSTLLVACKSTSDGQPHVVVVGAGAAGLTASYFAAQAGAKVTLLERTKESGKKILMSGGSRCNVLPMDVDLQRDFFTEGSRNSLKAIFASWSLARCREWLEQDVGLELGEEAETSKVFPLSNSSREVRDKLLEACMRQGVDVRFNASLEGLSAVRVDEPPSVSDANAQLSVLGSGSSSEGKVRECGSSSSSKSELSDGLKSNSSSTLQQRSRSELSKATSSNSSSSYNSCSSNRRGDSKLQQREEEQGHVNCSPSVDGSHSLNGSQHSVQAVSSSSGSSGRDLREAECRSSNDRENSSITTTSGSSGVGSSSSSSNGSSSCPAKLRWLCRLGGGGQLEAEKLILCTGGLSFPAVGTDGTGHRILQHLGHDVIQPYPALTPLQGRHPANQQLAGLSMYDVEMWAEPAAHAQQSAAGGGQATAAAKKRALQSQRNALLFTHKGFSGPSVLDLSHVVIMAMLRNQPPPTIRVSWTRDAAAAWEERLKAGGTAFVSTALQRAGIRERLADALCEELQLQDRKMSELKKSERAALVSLLTSYELKWTGHEGYKKAEVTGGGVPLSQITTSTMESKTLPGIFLAGEICDVFGRIGGFNFYWAWVSGRLAGLGAAKRGSLEQPKKGKKVKGGAKAR